MSKIKAHKTVYNRTQFDSVVDREFNFFTQPSGSVEPLSVEEFFSTYEELFYDIPPTGDNSHEYLIRRSREIVDFEQESEDIEPLINEITQLREQLLEANRTIVELQSSIDSNE